MTPARRAALEALAVAWEDEAKAGQDGPYAAVAYRLCAEGLRAFLASSTPTHMVDLPGAVDEILQRHPGADTYTARLARLCLAQEHRLAALERGGPAGVATPAARAAAHGLLLAMWLYPNYRLEYRTTWRALVDALGVLAPDLHTRILADEDLSTIIDSARSE